MLGIAPFVEEVQAVVEELVGVEAVKLQLPGLVLGAFFGEFGFEFVFNLRGVSGFEALLGERSGLGVVGVAGFELALFELAPKIGVEPLFLCPRLFFSKLNRSQAQETHPTR